MQILPLGYPSVDQALALPSKPGSLATTPLPLARRARCVIAGWDAQRASELRTALESFSASLPVALVNGLPVAPSTEAIERMIETERAALLFLDVDNLQRAAAVLAEIRRLDRGTQVVAFSQAPSHETLLTLMRFGVKEWLRVPCHPVELEGVLERTRAELNARPPQFRRQGQILSVLPAKPGSGASTFAAHAAQAFAHDLAARTLLLDFDLNCGIQGFLHPAASRLTVADAAEYADRMDEVIWSKMVTSTGSVDLLCSGRPTLGRRTDPAALRGILDYAEIRYPVTVVDLSGNWERYAIETMERSALVFVVATTDFSSLHLVHRQMELLAEIGARDRIRIVLNRCSPRGEMPRNVIEQILGQPPAAELPNSFGSLQDAVRRGHLLDHSTGYARAIRDLSAQVIPCLEPSNVRGAHTPRQGVLRALRSWLTLRPKYA